MEIGRANVKLQREFIKAVFIKKGGEEVYLHYLMVIMPGDTSLPLHVVSPIESCYDPALLLAWGHIFWKSRFRHQWVLVLMFMLRISIFQIKDQL